jgi:Mor family transcriptional regulator
MIDEQMLLEKFSPDHPRYGQLIELGRRLGAAGLNELMEMWGGEKKHIPEAATFWEKLFREVRNEEIKAKFNGRNYDSLAEEYQMDVRSMYRIIHNKR